MKFVARHAEFEKLKKTYPSNADQLDQIVEHIGPKSVIKLHELSLQDIAHLDTSLIDHLYKSAYAIQADSFWSYYIQLSEILALPKSKVSHILEIGIGIGILRSLIKNYDYRHITLDLDPERKPDLLGDVTKLPFQTKSFDMVCAFEVLEHMPFHFFQPALQEMVRCAKHYVFISLPCPSNHIYFHLRLTFLQRFFRRFSGNLEFLKLLSTNLPDKNEQELLKREDKHNPHYWEVNRHSFPKQKVFHAIEETGLKIKKTLHSHHHPYHFFILCEVK